VDGPGDQLFARARLAVDHDAALEWSEPRQRREELADDLAASDQRSEPLRRPRVDSFLLGVLIVDEEIRRADSDGKSVQNARRLDPHSLDERAVAAVEVANPDPLVARFDLRVHARHGGVGDDHIAVGGRADDASTLDRGGASDTSLRPFEARKRPHRRGRGLMSSARERGRSVAGGHRRTGQNDPENVMR
jgi:hypothetical protein